MAYRQGAPLVSCHQTVPQGEARSWSSTGSSGVVLDHLGLSPSEQSNRRLSLGRAGDELARGQGNRKPEPHSLPELPEVAYLHDAQTDGPLVTCIPDHAKLQQSLWPVRGGLHTAPPKLTPSLGL